MGKQWLVFSWVLLVFLSAREIAGRLSEGICRQCKAEALQACLELVDRCHSNAPDRRQCASSLRTVQMDSQCCLPFNACESATLQIGKDAIGSLVDEAVEGWRRAAGLRGGPDALADESGGAEDGAASGRVLQEVGGFEAGASEAESATQEDSRARKLRERRRTVSRRAAGTGTNLLSKPGVAKPGAKRGLTSKGAKIYDLDGREVNFHGIAWFGFNNLQTMVGLGHGPDNMSRDFKTIVWRMKMLGFNAVRLAFSFHDLALEPKNFTGPCEVVDLEEARSYLIPPDLPQAKVGKLPQLPPEVPGGICNADLPNTKTYDRFLYVVEHFAKEGFYVSIDFHSNSDGDVSLFYKDHWVEEWIELVGDLTKIPELEGRLMLDIINEPDGYDLSYDERPGKNKLDTDSKKPGVLARVTDYYTAVMDAVYPICPWCLFLLEGCGQAKYRANWGDGFNIDQHIVKKYRISDAASFFEVLITKKYLQQVVLAPHVYCPAVSGAIDHYAGSGLYYKLSASFGEKAMTGYCTGRKCHQFAIVNGEFGTGFQNQAETDCWYSIVKYMNNVGDARDKKHLEITSWFYWAWNFDSDDTGGIMESDWKSVSWIRIAALAGGTDEFPQGLGLQPWYLKTSAADLFAQD